MDLIAFYKDIGGNFSKTEKNLVSRDIIEELVIDFLEDTSFDTLINGITNGNIETAFIGAHTLKGVSGSLGFDCLTDLAVSITEKLRNKIIPSPDEISKAEKEYRRIIDAINRYK